MPRNASDIYDVPEGSYPDPLTTIESARYTAALEDLVADANLARPVVAGGTGAETASQAAKNLAVVSTLNLAGVNTVSGTANAITCTTATDFEELDDSIVIAFTALADIAPGGATFALDGLDAVPIVKIVAAGAVDVNAGDIFEGMTYLLKYDSSITQPDSDPAELGCFVLLNGSANNGFQIGDYLDTIRTPNSDWLPRDGALYDIDDYPELAALLPVLPDGIDWEVRSSTVTPPVRGIVFAENKYAAVASTNFLTSSTGVTWAVRDTVASDRSYRAIAWGAGIFVAADIGTGRTATSPDAITWTEDSVLIAAGLGGIAYHTSGAIFCVVGADGFVATSPDSTTWTTRTSGLEDSGSGPLLRFVRYLNGVLIAGGQDGSLITSTDGTTWTIRTSGTSETLEDVAYYDGRYVVVGTAGTIRTSTTLGTWTAATSGTSEALNAIVASASGYLAVGNAGVALISGPQSGTAWTAAPTGAAVTLASIVVDPTNAARYIVGGISQTILDGLRTSPTQFRVPNDNPTNGWIKAVS